jgi:hypothetical protein
MTDATGFGGVKGALATLGGFAAPDSASSPSQNAQLPGPLPRPCGVNQRRVLEHSRRRSTRRRTGGSSAVLCGGAKAPTHVSSPRQLPTDHDHAGERNARSANIRVINRRFCRVDRRLVCSRAPHDRGALEPTSPRD